MRLAVLAVIALAVACIGCKTTDGNPGADGADGSSAAAHGTGSGGDVAAADGGSTGGGSPGGGVDSGAAAGGDDASTTGAPECEGVMVSGACVEPGGQGDNLVLIGSFNGNSFVEILDVEYLHDYVFFCAGTKGLAVYYAPPNGGPTYIVHSGGLGSGSHGSFPRCQHIAFGELPDHAGTGRLDVFVTNRGDETQPTPWIKWVRFEHGITAVHENYNKTHLPVLSTLFGDPAMQAFEGIDFEDGLVYAAVHNQGIAVIDTADDQLTVLTTIPVGGNVYDVRVLDSGVLVVATVDDGLHVYDRADPNAPSFVGKVNFDGPLTRLAADGPYVYGAAGASGLGIFDISVPSAPVHLSTFQTPGTVMDVNVSDGRVVLADWTDLRVVDVSDPLHPWLFAAEQVPGIKSFTRVLAADVIGDRVFVGEWTALLAYRLQPDHTPPDIRTVQTELTFAEDTGARGVVVHNEGWQALEITAKVAGPYEATPTTLTIEPGAKALIEVTLTGQAVGSALTLTTNDPDEPTVTIPIAVKSAGFGVGPGDEIPKDWQVLNLQTGQPESLRGLIEGKVALLAYFATF